MSWTPICLCAEAGARGEISGAGSEAGGAALGALRRSPAAAPHGYLPLLCAEAGARGEISGAGSEAGGAVSAGNSSNR